MSSRLHDLAVDTLGRRIVDGAMPAGATVHAAALGAELGVSRSVVREAVRVLASLGLVESVKRLGIRVLPPSHWNVFDASVIRWRLASARKGAQLRSLTELRSAVEPAAAELAAQSSSAEDGAELGRLAERMTATGRAGLLQDFLDLDIRFHALVLASSENEMFAHLDGAVAEVLRGRTDYGLMPTRPHEEALQLHRDVASAIQERRPADAREAMERIMRRTVAEVEPMWRDEPR